MSGEPKSFKERLKEYESVLDQYNVKIGVAHILYHTEVNAIMLYNGDELRGLSAEECGEGAFILSNYAAFIQMEYNRQKARVEWAETELTKIIGSTGDRYGDGYTKYELRKARCIADDSSAKVLGDIIRHAGGRAIQLEGIADGLRDMARYLNGLQFSKGNKR